MLRVAEMSGTASDDAADTGTEATEETATEETDDSSASGEAAPNNEVTVIGSNFDFNQDEYVVQSGEEVTLTYVNEEGNHGITIDGLDVDIQGEGEVTFIPEKPGEYNIICNIFCGTGHEEMVAKLVVL